jgi:predicted lysophospholipase L1 biosynthesis ABC-type transport system permease subunit
VAVIAIVGQFLVRQLGRRAMDRRHLLALGYTGRQTTAEQVGWAAVIVAFGTVLAMAIAVLASPLFPRGFVRVLDPDAGDLVVAPLALAGAAAVMAVAVMAWVAVGVLLTRRAGAVDRPSGAAEALARAGVTPSTVTGVRFALSRGRDNTSVWAACGTLFVATATVLGAVVFASSLSRLVAEPARFGSNFDLLVDSGDEPLPPNALDGVTGVAGASVMATTSASVDGRTVDVVGVEPLRGAVLPRVLQGRFPASADEVALGAVTARQLHAHIGDTVMFTGDSGQPAPFRVVGTAVIPAPNSFGDGGGYGAAMLQAGLMTISPSTSFGKLALQLAPGAKAPDTIAGLPVGATVGISRPADVVNLARARSIPVALAVVVGVLGAMTLAHALITSVRHRRQDFAVLRALGADRGWIGRTVHVQASTIAVVALIGGIPLGIVAGRIVFRLLVDQLGLVSDPTMPVVLIAVTSVAVLVLANLAAVIPGRRAARLPIASLLRAE